MKTIIFMVMIVFLYGCTQGIQYKEVLIPQKCNVSQPKKPICKAKPNEWKEIYNCAVNQIQYTKLLEARLYYCTH